MAIPLQLRRGTKAQNDVFTGVLGEVTVDTESKNLRLHDGSTTGGVEFPNSTNALTGFKNHIINGGFDIWQRGTSFNSAGYTADRWTFEYADTVTLEADGTMKVIGSNASSRFRQAIEGDFLCGKTATLSIACDDPSSSITIRHIVNGGSWNADTANFSHVNSEGFRVFVATFTFGAKITGGSVSAEIYTTLKTVKYKEIQLESGSVATPFEQRPIGLELSLCQRYYEVITLGAGAYSETSTILRGVFSYEEKRVAPSIVFDGLFVYLRQGNDKVNLVLTNLGNTYKNSSSFNSGSATGLIVGEGGYVTSTTANDVIRIDAEL